MLRAHARSCSGTVAALKCCCGGRRPWTLLHPAGVPRQEKQVNSLQNLRMLWMYLLHHVFTAAAYAFSLYTHHLSSLCSIGLAFETPVVFVNIREFITMFDEVVLREPLLLPVSVPVYVPVPLRVPVHLHVLASLPVSVRPPPPPGLLVKGRCVCGGGGVEVRGGGNG